MTFEDRFFRGYTTARIVIVVALYKNAMQCDGANSIPYTENIDTGRGERRNEFFSN